MAMQMPPPSPRTEKRRLTGAAEDLEVLASPSKRGTPTSRSFFSGGTDIPRTPADVSWTREQAGSTPRALDRDFVAAEAMGGNQGGASGGGTSNTRATASTPSRAKMYNRRTWTKEENEQLQTGIASLGGSDGEMGKNEWNTIAHEFLMDSRTGTQCATHWRMVLKPALLKGVWSAEEDGIIYDCVARGVTDWSEIASHLPKRKAKHCRERWNTHLDPALSKTDLTPEEESKLLSAVEVHGTNWAQIACVLPGRSESTIQQHWNTVLFRNATNAAANAVGGVRRARGRTESAPSTPAQPSNRARSKSSSLPVDSMPPPQPPSQDVSSRKEVIAGNGSGGSGRSGTTSNTPVVVDHGGSTGLTERERALMDHAFKSGLQAAAGSSSTVTPVRAEKIDAIPKGGEGIEKLTLASEEDDVLAPLSAALLKTEDIEGVSPEMPPPSPTTSPLKPNQQPDYTAVGNQLLDGWGPDEDPALADLYRSLDNIGESLFNEDNFELSFDFDSVDKPSSGCESSSAIACSSSNANTTNGATETTNTTAVKPTLSPPRNWESTLTPSQGQKHKEVSPFRRAAAQAAATMQQRHAQSPSKYDGQRQGTGLQAACARAAAAAAAAASTGHSASSSSSKGAGGLVKSTSSIGPKVKQGFLRRLLPPDSSNKPVKLPCTTFATIRGCLSEVNAPPPLPPIVVPMNTTSGIGAGRNNESSIGENRVPRRGQRLSVALFATPSGVPADGKCLAVTTLKHGKAEVTVPAPETPGPGPHISLPASRYNTPKQEIDPSWGERQGGA